MKMGILAEFHMLYLYCERTKEIVYFDTES